MRKDFRKEISCKMRSKLATKQNRTGILSLISMPINLLNHNILLNRRFQQLRSMSLLWGSRLTWIGSVKLEKNRKREGRRMRTDLRITRTFSRMKKSTRNCSTSSKWSCLLEECNSKTNKRLKCSHKCKELTSLAFWKTLGTHLTANKIHVRRTQIKQLYTN